VGTGPAHRLTLSIATLELALSPLGNQFMAGIIKRARLNTGYLRHGGLPAGTGRVLLTDCISALGLFKHPQPRSASL
jgi:hypothetical protein